MIPSKVFFTKGMGKHKEKLQSFEAALRNAGIAACNLVMVSSILPPRCRLIALKRGLAHLKPGEITFVVLARSESNEPGRQLFASVGLAQPSRGDQYGYLSEHHGYGQTDEVAGDYAEDLAATMLATTLGIDFDPNIAWDERKKVYKMSRQFVRTSNVTQSARGDKNGMWTTVIAAAVMLE